jgi:hypothetical protein
MWWSRESFPGAMRGTSSGRRTDSGRRVWNSSWLSSEGREARVGDGGESTDMIMTTKRSIN